MSRPAWRLSPFVVAERPNPGGVNRRREAPSSKLTEEMVRCIKRAHANGQPISVIHAAYPEVKVYAIQEIIRGRAWRWVKL